MSQRIVLTALIALSVAACGRTAQEPIDLITADELHRHIAVLASDEFEGRAPASRGEELTLEYLQSEFEAVGAIPGNGDSFLQEIPLVSITADPDMTLSIRGEDGTMDLTYGTGFMAGSRRVTERVSVADSELVFVGYGVVAPEYGWNDYEGLDVRGKTVVILVNDPGFATGDPDLFTGRAMTYYGRWTYKYEEASRQGAAAAIIVHETEPASYGWEVVSGSWSGAQFGLVADDLNMSRVAVEGWVTESVARALFSRAGQDFDEMKEAALSADFSPVPLGLTASVDIHNTIRQSVSNNFIAMIPGSVRPDEYVIYTAHWDHLGKQGDDIYNGAADNASGTAGLLVLARAFAAMETAPERTIVFLPVTAEEQGLLGSQHYAENPILPLDRTAAVINVDVLNYIGPTNDITVVGYGASELDAFVDEVAMEFGRTVMPDQRPEAGVYYRSDHFNFAKVGVPALYPNMGRDLVDGGTERGHELAAAYTRDRYHQATDEYSPDMDWRGGAADLRLLFEIGRRIADSDAWPNWVEGNEFRAARDAMMSDR
jgi:Zn-dependent M28 family amino/carboxypeptidase